MMGLAWRSLELRIKRDPEFRRQMIEKYRQACRDDPCLGNEFDHFLGKLGILDEVRSSDERGSEECETTCPARESKRLSNRTATLQDDAPSSKVEHPSGAATHQNVRSM